MKVTDESVIQRLIKLVESQPDKDRATPFASAVVRTDEIISETLNTSRDTKDPTAHAEVNAIRQACSKLKNRHLSDCVLFSTCEPCPMCFTAAWMAKIPKIVYGTTIAAVDKTGRRQLGFGSMDLNKATGRSIKLVGGVLEDQCQKLAVEYGHRKIS